MDNTPEKIIFQWWRELNAAREKDREGIYTNFTTADSAILRRAQTLDDILLTSSAYFELYNRLKNTDWRDHTRIALIAGVVAHIRLASLNDTPSAFVNSDYSKSALELRFQRLLQNKNHEDIFVPMIRLIKHISQQGVGVHVSHLAESLYLWDDETRKKWVISFYNALQDKKEKK